MHALTWRAENHLSLVKAANCCGIQPLRLMWLIIPPSMVGFEESASLTLYFLTAESNKRLVYIKNFLHPPCIRCTSTSVRTLDGFKLIFIIALLKLRTFRCVINHLCASQGNKLLLLIISFFIGLIFAVLKHLLPLFGFLVEHIN